MPYLYQTARDLKVNFIKNKIANLHSLFTKHNIVINCAGAGARDLCADLTVRPARGQLVFVEKPSELSQSIACDDQELTYILPRTYECAIGGTFELDNNNPLPDPVITEKMLQRAYQLYPELRHQKIIRECVGFRPYRDTVRLEIDPSSTTKKLLIHNYGHSGSGVTLAWGCAEAVLKLIISF